MSDLVNESLSVHITVHPGNVMREGFPLAGRNLPEGGPSGWRASSRGVWQPPTDVYETEEDVWVRMEIAGMKTDDFIIHLNDRELVIRGIRSDIPEKRSYHQMEIYFGEFYVQIELPIAVVAKDVQANYQDGFLRMVLPKVQPQPFDVEGN